MADTFKIKLGATIDLTSLEQQLQTTKLKIQIDTAYIQQQIQTALSGIGTASGTTTGATTSATASASESAQIQQQIQATTSLITQQKVITTLYDEQRNAIGLIVTGLDNEGNKLREVYSITQEQTAELTRASTQSGALINKNAQTYDKLSTRLQNLGETGKITKEQFASFGTELERINKIEDPFAKQQEMQKFNQTLSDSTKHVMTFGDMLKTAFEKFAIWSIATVTWYGVIRALKDVITQVVSLNEAMTSLQMVTQYTNAQMDNLKGTYIELGKEMGVTLETVTTGADEFLRAGLDAKKTNDALRASLVWSSVANMDSAESTKYLIAQMNAFNVAASDLISLVDKMSAVDISAATSSQELGEALSFSSASANLAGLSYDKFLGMVATVSETTRQSASNIGNFFKTLFSRMQQVKLGSLVDEDGEDISNVAKVMSEYGIDIMEVSDNLTDMGALLDTLHLKWNTLASAEKSEIATTLAGVRQRERFLVLMDKYDRALELEQVSLESAGTATEKYNIYLQSVEASLNRLSTAWTELADATVESDVVRWFIDLATSILETITASGGLVNAIGNLIGVLLVLKALKISSEIKAGAESIKFLGYQFNVATGAATKFNVALGAIGIVATAITLVVAAVSKIKQGLEEAKQATIDLAEENISSAQDLKSQYMELIVIENRTTEQESELAAIQEKIIKNYGEIKKGIEATTSAYDPYIDKLNEATEAEINKMMAVLEPDYNKAIQKLKGTQGKAGGFVFSGKKGMELENEKAYSLIQEGIESGIISQYTDIGGLYATFTGGYYDFEDFYNKWIAYYGELTNKTQLDIELNENLGKIYAQNNATYGDYIRTIEEYEEFQQRKIDLQKEDVETLDDLYIAQDKVSKGLQEEIDNLELLQSQLSTSEELTEQQELELELQEKLLDVEEKRWELEKAKSQKIRIYRKGQGFVYESDQTLVAEAEKDYQEALAEQREVENKLNVLKQKQVYAEQIKDLETFLAEWDAMLSNNTGMAEWVAQQSGYNDFLAADYETKLKMAQEFMEKYQAIMDGSTNTSPIIVKPSKTNIPPYATTRHNGGGIGVSRLENNEVVTKLLRGEYVLTDKMQQNLIAMVNGKENGGVVMHISNLNAQFDGVSNIEEVANAFTELPSLVIQKLKQRS